MTDWIELAEGIDVAGHSPDGRVSVHLRGTGELAVELSEDVLERHGDDSLAGVVTEVLRLAQSRFRAAWDDIRGGPELPVLDIASGLAGEGVSAAGCALWREDGDGTVLEYRPGTLQRFDMSPEWLAEETAGALMSARDAYIDRLMTLVCEES